MDHTVSRWQIIAPAPDATPPLLPIPLPPALLQGKASSHDVAVSDGDDVGAEAVGQELPAGLVCAGHN